MKAKSALKFQPIPKQSVTFPKRRGRPRPLSRRFDLESLEPRELFSVSPLPPVAAILFHDEAPAALPSAPTNSAAVSLQAPVSTPDNWTGTAGDGLWLNPANWDNGVPTTNSDVSIPLNANVTITSGAQSANSLQAAGNLSIVSGSLTIAADSQISGNLSVNSTLTTNGKLTTSGTTTFGPGTTLSGTGSLVNTGTLNITTSISINAALTNNHIVNWSAGDLSLGSGITFTNAVGGTMSVTSNGTLTGAGTLSNAGELDSASNPNLENTFQATFNNTGTLHVTAGILLFNNTGTSSGIFNVDPGAILVFSTLFGGHYQVAPGAQWNGAGLYEITGFSEVTLNDTTVHLSVQHFTLNGGSIDGPGSLTIPSGGSFTWNAGSIALTSTLTVSHGATLTAAATTPGNSANGSVSDGKLDNFGAATFTDFSVQFVNNGSFANESGATWSWSIDFSNSAQFYGTGSITNSGALTTSNNGNSLQFQVPYNDLAGATLESSKGDLDFFGGGTSAGAWTSDSGASITFGSGYTVGAGTQWNGAGVYGISMGFFGTATIAAGASLSPQHFEMLSQGTLNLLGAITIPSGGEFDAGYDDTGTHISGSGTLTISQGGTMNIGEGQGWLRFDGVSIVNKGTMNFDADSTFSGLTLSLSSTNIENDGLIKIASQGGTVASNIAMGGAGASTIEALLTNSATGTFEDDVTSAVSLQMELNNNGNFNVNKGSLTIQDFSPDIGTSSGAFDVAANASLTFQEAQTFNPGAALNGTGAYHVNSGGALNLNDASIQLSPLSFSLDGGTLSGTGSFAIPAGGAFTWNAGTIGTSTFTVPAGVSINYPGVIGSAKLDGTHFVNNGSLTMGSQAVGFENGAIFDNEASGTVTINVPNGAGFVSFNGIDGTDVFNNYGTFKVLGANHADTIAIEFNPFNNQGVLDVESVTFDTLSNGTVSQISNDGSTLTGGTWIAKNAQLTLFSILTSGGNSHSPVSVINNAAQITLDGATSAFNALNNLTTNSGSLSLLNGAALTTAVLTNSGTLEAGAGSKFTVSGNFTQTSAGTLVVHLAGAPSSNQFGSVAVSGSAKLAGALNVALDNSFIPTVGDAWSILTYSGHTGDFTTFQNVSGLFNAGAGSASYKLTAVNANLPNLVASGVSASASAVSGQPLTVTYNVTNSGQTNATGSWTDSIYLSPGTTFDPTTAVFVGNVSHSGGLAAGNSYNGSLTATTPGLLPGNYVVIVVADSLGQAADLNRNDNIAASSTPIAVSPPKLTLGTPYTGAIGQNQEQLYEIDLSGNSQSIISLNTGQLGGAEIYVRYGALPSPTAFDQFAYAPSGASDSITLSADLPGPYYILIRGRESAGSSSPFTLEVSQSIYGITSLSPTAGSGHTTITVHGAGFSPGDSVSLVPSGGGAAILATNIYFADSSNVSATFDLTGLTAGAVYDVQVSNGVSTSTASGAFTIGNPVNGATPHPILSITAPAFVRAGLDYTIQVNYTNNSNQDELAPLITLSATNALLKFFNSAIFANGTVAFLGINTQGGPAGILPPGYQGSITVQVHQTNPVNHIESSFTAAVTDPNLAMDYSALAPYVTSSSYSPTDWANLWADFQQRLGVTQAGYLSALSRDASLLPAVAGDNKMPLDVISLELQQSFANVSTSIRGAVASGVPGLQLGGLLLEATNSTTGDAFSTYILNDGSFVLPGITPGAYRFSVEGANLQLATNVNITSGQHLTGIQLTADDGATLLGSVSKNEDGSILAGATIEATDASGNDFFTTSDANGKYQFKGLVPGTYRIIANADGRGELVQENVSLSADGLLRDLRLAAASTISGTLPISTGASITAQPAGNTDPNLVFQAVPDAQGHFSFASLPAGTYDLTITLNGYNTAQVTGVVVAAGQSVSTGQINLTAAATINGAVSTSDLAQSLSGLQVSLFHNGSLINTVATDQNGNFHFSGLAAGTYQIVPSGYSYFASDETIQVAAGQTFDNASVILQPGGEIGGVLTGPGGPVAGAPVYAFDSQGNANVAYTDTAGNYLFEHLALGSYNVFAATNGPASASAINVTSLDSDPVTANFNVNVAQQIAGKLLLSDGQTPVSNGYVSLFQNGLKIASSVTDSAGNYSFALSQPGTYTLEASAGNASFSGIANVVVNSNATVQRNLIAGSGSLNLTVTDAGDTVDGSIAILYETSTNQEVGVVLLDATGLATFTNLVDDSYRVVVENSDNRGGQVNAIVSGGTGSATVAQQAQATVTGKITDASTTQPISSAFAALYSTTDPNIVFFSPVASDGTYSFVNVPAGTYDAVAFAASYAASIQANLTITATGAVRNFALSTSGNTHLTGTVRDQSNQPVLGALVTVVNAQQEILGRAITGANGTFDIASATGSGLTLQISYVEADPIAINGLTVTNQSTTALGNVQASILLASGARPQAPFQTSLVSPNRGGFQPAGQSSSGNPFGSLPDLSFLSPDSIFDAIKAEAQAFTHDPNEVKDVSGPPSCPGCSDLYIIALNAKRYQDFTYNQRADPLRDILIQQIGNYNSSVIRDTAQNIGTATALVALFYAAGPLFGLAVGATGASAEILEGTTAFLDIVTTANDLVQVGKDLLTAFQQASLGEDLNQVIAGNFDKLEQLSIKMVKLASTLEQIMLSSAEKKAAKLLPGVNVLLSSLQLIADRTSIVDGLTYATARKNAEDINSSQLAFYDARETYRKAVADANTALKNYNGCVAGSSQSCQPGGGGGGSSGGGGSTGPGGTGPSGGTTQLSGHDPNDLFGPGGFGSVHFVSPDQLLAYTIDFENDPDASAPAQIVTITQHLDSNLDLTTFSLGSFGFGGLTFNVPAGQTSYSNIIDNTSATGLDVQVTASLNVATATVTWTFTSLDPKTGQLTADPLAGFLPPDADGSEGLGFVTYQVKPKANLSTGATITAQASVVFDNNPAIDTPSYSNTIDAGKPSSSVQTLASSEPPRFVLHWSGSDDANGSGIAAYDVYFSDNGGSYQPFLTNTTLTSSVFNGTVGHTYAFYSVAVDNVGNVESVTPSSDTTTTIAPAQTVNIDAKHPFTFLDASGDKVTVKLSGPGSAVATLDGIAGAQADLESIALSSTTAKSSLSVTISTKNGTTTVGQIFTTATGESMGSIVLGPGVTLGDGFVNATPNLKVGGSLKSLSVSTIDTNAVLNIGTDLTGPAAAAAKPSITVGSILGPNVAISAVGGLGAVKIGSWAFAGSLSATGAIASVSVTGALDANLTAASFGNIAASSFTELSITALSGGVGNLSAKLLNQTGDVAAMDHVIVSAASIGNISASVTGAAALTSAVAIRDSSFQSNTGKIGNITAMVSAKGSAAAIEGIDQTNFYSAAGIGNIIVSATETKSTGGSTVGIDNGSTNLYIETQGNTGNIGNISVVAQGAAGPNTAVLSAPAGPLVVTTNGSLGKVTITANKGPGSSTASALNGAFFNVGGSLGQFTVSGDATSTQMANSYVTVGGAIAGINVSSKDKIHGSLFDSTILAGQSQTPNSNSALAKAGIGSIKISGNLSTDAAPGVFVIGSIGNIGAISVGGDLANYAIVAGLNAGADQSIGGTDNTYNSNAAIAGVKVTGAFSNTSIIAGVNPGADHIWGGNDDAKATALAGVKQTSRIGAIVLGAGTLPAGVSGILSTPLTTGPVTAIEAPQITSLTIGKLKSLKAFTTAGGFLDVNGNGEDVADTAVRLIT